MFFRDQLKRHYNLGQYYIEVQLEDVASFDENLAEKLVKQPTEHTALVGHLCSKIINKIIVFGDDNRIRD